MLYAIVTVLILILDQGIKYETSLRLALGETSPLINGVIHFTNYHNTGAAFSIFSAEQFRWPLLIITVLFVIAVIVLIAVKAIKGKFGRWCAVMVMAGAIGNGIDRALFGYVVDMFEPEFIKFAVFNVADIFITVGGILFCLYVLLYRQPAEQPAAGDKVPPVKHRPVKAKAPEELPPTVQPAVPAPVVSEPELAEPVAPKLEDAPTWTPPVEKPVSAPKAEAQAEAVPSLEDILREFGEDL